VIDGQKQILLKPESDNLAKTPQSCSAYRQALWRAGTGFVLAMIEIGDAI
jgi:hypothetical protein